MDNKRKETEDYYEEHSKKYKNPRTHDPLLPHELHLPFPTFGMPPERTDVDRQSYGYYNNNGPPPPPRYHPYPEMPPQYYKPPPVQQSYQDHYYEPSVCNLCGRIAVDPDRILIPTSLCFHRACYFEMMSRGPSFYQSVAAPPHHMSPPPISEVVPAEPIEISVNNNPEKFQIANYNLFPTPSLVVEKANTVNRQVTAYLVENMKHNVIEKGFRAGETALIRAGAKTVIFTGLKLNKMGHLKSELQKFNLRPKDVSFYIQFVIGSTVVKSDTFRIVSSFSQLTSEEQDKRPSSSKKTSQNTDSPPQKSNSAERVDLNRDEESNVNKRVD